MDPSRTKFLQVKLAHSCCICDLQHTRYKVPFCTEYIYIYIYAFIIIYIFDFPSYMSSHNCSIVAAKQTKQKQICFSPFVVVLYSIPNIYYHIKYQDPTSFCSVSVLPCWNSAQLLYWW